MGGVSDRDLLPQETDRVWPSRVIGRAGFGRPGRRHEQEAGGRDAAAVRHRACGSSRVALGDARIDDVDIEAVPLPQSGVRLALLVRSGGVLPPVRLTVPEGSPLGR